VSGSENREKSDSDYAVVCAYWRIYGGWTSLFTSAYFYAAVVLAISGYAVWSQSGWWELPQSILPNMLGFSLAGYAIFLSFGSESFRRFLSSVQLGSSSAFVSLTTTFMHFVVLQVCALLVALACGFLAEIKVPSYFPMSGMLPCFQRIGWFFGFILFCYSLTTTLASVIAIYRVVRLFDLYSRRGA